MLVEKKQSDLSGFSSCARGSQPLSDNFEFFANPPQRFRGIEHLADRLGYFGSVCVILDQLGGDPLSGDLCKLSPWERRIWPIPE